GFNGGSAGASGPLAASPFSATQAAAAAAGLSWRLAGGLHRGKPTAPGPASGIGAGAVAVTPASRCRFSGGGLASGRPARVVCYAAVCLKPALKYDDSLDAFGVHGIGGLLGALLTGVFCYKAVNSAGADGLLATRGGLSQLTIQVIAAGASVVFAFTVSFVLVKVIDLAIGFTTDEASEIEGLDRTEHGEVGFDLSPAMEMVRSAATAEPKAARVPPDSAQRFSVVVEGVNNGDLTHAWSALCQPGDSPPEEAFRAVYPFVTTVEGNRFRFRGGDRLKLR